MALYIKNLVRNNSGQFRVILFAIFVVGLLAVFNVKFKAPSYSASKVKGFQGLTEKRMKALQAEQMIRIKELLVLGNKTNSLMVTTPHGMHQSSQSPNFTSNKSGNLIVDQLNEIKEKMKEFGIQMKQLVGWQAYEEHREKLKSLLLPKTLLRSPSFNNTNGMFRPHVLVDDTLDCKKQLKVVILVTSFARHFERRQWIRKAWGNQTFWKKELIGDWQVIFNVGVVKATDRREVHQKLLEESKKHGDLLMLDVSEDFHKLSVKVMAGLYWVYTKFNFQFVLKTDDDIFVHMHHLFTKLNGDWRDKHFIGWGQFIQMPQRDKGRYGVTLEEWSGKYYDPYCSGGGYVLSHSIIERMIPHFNWETPLKIDDAYIGYLVKLAGGKLHNQPKYFLMWNDKCEYTQDFVVSHPVKVPAYRNFLVAKVDLELGRIETHAAQNVTSLKELKEGEKKKQNG